MALSKDGEDRQSILNLVSTLLAQQKCTPNRDLQEYRSLMQLSLLLDKLSKTVGSMKEMETITDTEPTTVDHGAAFMNLSGDALERRSIETLKVMLRSVPFHIKASGFPEKVHTLAACAEVLRTLKGDMRLTIKLSIEKV